MGKKTFIVSVTRTAHSAKEFNISIDSTGDPKQDERLAKEKALGMAYNHDFGTGQDAEYDANVDKFIDG